jgi:neocarzinostatin family protein
MDGSTRHRVPSRNARLRPIRILVRSFGFVAVIAAFLPLGARVASASSVTVANGCQNNVQPGTWAEIDLLLTGTPPSSAAAGSAATVTGLSVTAELSAAYIQAGIGLGIIQNGQTINGHATITIAATNATPASTTLTGAGSGTVQAPGGVAQPLAVKVSLPDTGWTPTASGAVSLAEPLSGSLHNSSVPQPTDGSAEIDATLPPATSDNIHIICKPGTVNTATPAVFTPAASTTPFVTFQAGSGGGTTTTSAQGTTTTTTPGSTTTTTTGSTTTTTATTSTTTGSSSTTAAPAGGATIQVSSAKSLQPGEVVSVTGSGFDAGATVAVLECSPLAATAASAQNECDITHAATTTATAAGAISVNFKVVESGAAAPNNFAPSDSKAVCPPPAGQADCVIAAANILNQSEHGSVDITFMGTQAQTSTAASRGQASTSGTTTHNTSGTAALPNTGPGRVTLILLGGGLLLLDLGYVAITSTRPGRRVASLLRGGRG